MAWFAATNHRFRLLAFVPFLWTMLLSFHLVEKELDQTSAKRHKGKQPLRIATPVPVQ